MQMEEAQCSWAVEEGTGVMATTPPNSFRDFAYFFFYYYFLLVSPKSRPLFPTHGHFSYSPTYLVSLEPSWQVGENPP